MIKSKSEMPKRPFEIDLTGPDGNVFVLMGYAVRLAKEIYGRKDENLVEVNMVLQDLGIEEVPDNMGEIICEKMMESDYENAIKVFDSYFGSFVTLYR